MSLGAAATYAFSDASYALIGPLAPGSAVGGGSEYTIVGLSADSTIRQGDSDVATDMDSDDSSAMPLVATDISPGLRSVPFRVQPGVEYLAVKSASGAATITIAGPHPRTVMP